MFNKIICNISHFKVIPVYKYMYQYENMYIIFLFD